MDHTSAEGQEQTDETTARVIRLFAGRLGLIAMPEFDDDDGIA